MPNVPSDADEKPRSIRYFDSLSVPYLVGFRNAGRIRIRLAFCIAYMVVRIKTPARALFGVCSIGWYEHGNHSLAKTKGSIASGGDEDDI